MTLISFNKKKYLISDKLNCHQLEFAFKYLLNLTEIFVIKFYKGTTYCSNQIDSELVVLVKLMLRYYEPKLSSLGVHA